MKKIVIGLYISLLCMFSGFAQQAVPAPVKPKVVSPRISGLGAPYTTLEAGIDTLFTNPAAFAFLNRRWSASKIGLSITADAFSLAGAVFDNNKLEDFAEALFEKDKSRSEIFLTGPLALAITGKNFGAGIFNGATVIADMNAGIANKFLLGGEIFLTGGYGGRVFDDGSNSVSLGIQMKGFFQTFSYALSANRLYMKHAADNKLKSLNIVLANGIGIDLGFLYKYENGFSLGITCRDAYTAVFSTPYADFESYKSAKPSGKTQYKYVLPDISVGIGTMPVCNDIWETVSTWAFYFDYRDILSTALKKKHALLNLAAGTEIVFHKVLSFRLGLNECYPHLGCGLDFTYFQFNIAAYATEYGNKPWEKPVINLDFALSFEY
ncbi:hypothetical protein [Treponema pedis]|uniref:hypothetical protein n=1 Tax=Treponema pedis TaxID=409322 RepID=UPI00197EB459|nr:hypothetical protein [Treponema pedis]QSI03606.1 hypothetical protein DYQ05_01080 [Treponema pedis]